MSIGRTGFFGVRFIYIVVVCFIGLAGCANLKPRSNKTHVKAKKPVTLKSDVASAPKDDASNPGEARAEQTKLTLTEAKKLIRSEASTRKTLGALWKQIDSGTSWSYKGRSFRSAPDPKSALLSSADQWTDEERSSAKSFLDHPSAYDIYDGQAGALTVRIAMSLFEPHLNDKEVNRFFEKTESLKLHQSFKYICMEAFGECFDYVFEPSELLENLSTFCTLLHPGSKTRTQLFSAFRSALRKYADLPEWVSPPSFPGEYKPKPSEVRAKIDTYILESRQLEKTCH